MCTVFLLALHFGLLLVPSLYMVDNLQIFIVCPFDYTAVAVSGKVGYPKTDLDELDDCCCSNWPS